MNTKYNPILKGLELGLGKLVSCVHGMKRRKAVSWKRLGLRLTLTIDFSKKSFAMPRVYTIVFCLLMKYVTAPGRVRREAILLEILINDEIKLSNKN
jgi:hypothetical protein